MVKKSKDTTAKNKAQNVEELLQRFDNILFRGSDERWLYGRIPFDIPVLDKLIGGGIPKKRITLLSGQTNSGKSYLATQVVKSVQNSGGTTAWIDMEMSWDPDWMQKCGIDTDNIIVSQPITGESAFDSIVALMESGVDLIVFDSIAGVTPSAIIQEKDFSYNPMAWQARFVNQSLPKIMPHLKYGSALVLINQIRSSIGNVSFLEMLPGGKAQSFFSHIVLQIRRSGWITEKEIKVGFDIEITNRKTKAGGCNQSKCVIPFRFDGGIDIIEVYMREAINHNLIEKAGAWYNIVSGNIKLMGMNGLRDYYQQNPDSLQNLIVTISDLQKNSDSNIEELEEEINEEDILDDNES